MAGRYVAVLDSKDTISRASVINFLNDLVELGVLIGEDRTTAFFLVFRGRLGHLFRD